MESSLFLQIETFKENEINYIARKKVKKWIFIFKIKKT